MLALALALALGFTPEQADDRIRSMNELELAPSLYRVVEQPLTVKRGAMEVVVTDGVMVPVFSGRFPGEWEENGAKLLRALRESDKEATLPTKADRGDRELVGFVLVDGNASVAVSFPTKHDAIELASRQVMYAGADKAEMLEVARRRKPFVTTASEGLFLSIDPKLDELFLGRPDGDPYEVVVYDTSPPLGRAERLLEQRLELWETMGLPWGDVVAEERLVTEEGFEGDPSWIVDLNTEDRYARVSEMATEEDRWLSLVDRRGHLTPGWISEVFAAGQTPEGFARRIRISGEPMPPGDPDDPTSAPPVMLQLVPEHADVRLLVQRPRNDTVMDVEVTERIRFRAAAPTNSVWVVVPRVEAGGGGFEWVRASLPDGTLLSRPEQVGRESSRSSEEEPKPKPKPTPREKKEKFERLEELDRELQRVRLVFPEVIEAGEEVEVDLQWKDSWPYSHLVDGSTGVLNLGNTSGLQRFLPSVDGTDMPWNYKISVGLPVGSRDSVAVSGPVVSEEDVDGWHFVHTDEVVNARYPNVVVGHYDHKSFPAKKGLPAVQVRLKNADPKQLGDIASEARAAMAYMARYLPTYSLGEYDIVEAPSAINHYVWVAPHGMTQIQRMLQTQVKGEREDQARATFAHEVAHQWWGQMAQPSTLDDRWMIETFAEVFSCMYVAKANEDVEPCTDVLEENRRLAEGELWWEDIRSSASLEEAFVGGNKNQVVYRLGPYVMLNMLRPRVGTEAFFGALRSMLENHPGEPVTNQRLQYYMETTSGKDLDDFFDYWVYQGIIPKVDLAWWVHNTVVDLEVTSDVPFGTFDIPVVVEGDFGKKVVAVTVKDGVGRLEVEGDYRRNVKVTLDPAHRTLTRSRSVSKK